MSHGNNGTTPVSHGSNGTMPVSHDYGHKATLAVPLGDWQHECVQVHCDNMAVVNVLFIH